MRNLPPKFLRGPFPKLLEEEKGPCRRWRFKISVEEMTQTQITKKARIVFLTPYNGYLGKEEPWASRPGSTKLHTKRNQSKLKMPPHKKIKLRRGL